MSLFVRFLYYDEREFLCHYNELAHDMQGLHEQTCYMAPHLLYNGERENSYGASGKYTPQLSRSLRLHVKGPAYYDVQRRIWRTLDT